MINICMNKRTSHPTQKPQMRGTHIQTYRYTDTCIYYDLFMFCNKRSLFIILRYLLVSIHMYIYDKMVISTLHKHSQPQTHIQINKRV